MPKFRHRAVQFDAHSSQAIRSWFNIDNLSLALMPIRRVQKEQLLPYGDSRPQRQQCAMSIHNQRKSFFLKLLSVGNFPSNNKRYV